MSENKRYGDIKNKIFNGEERKVEQKLLRLMPGLPTFFDQLGNRIESFDGKQPRTLIANIKNDFNAFANTFSGRERLVARFLWHLLGKAAFQNFIDGLIEMTKRQAAADDRYSLLLKLMCKADEKVPHISMIVSLRHGDPEASLAPQCAPLEFLKQAEQETGEARATTVLHALATTAEFLYKPYLITIWSLSYFKEGKVPPQHPEFGDLVKAADRRLQDYPGLVELNAAWMRNAAIHHLPDYDFSDDSLILKDRKTQPVKVRVDDLLEMVQRMYLISGMTIARVGQLYMFRDLYVRTGLFDMFILCMPHILSGNKERIAQAEQEITEHAKTLIEPVELFFNSHTGK